MEIILDTSFILTCLDEGTDFLEAGAFGDLLLPEQVVNELKKLVKGKGREKEQAELALCIIEKNKDKFKLIGLERKYADAGIIKYVSGRENLAVATADRDLKRQLKGKARILTIRARKKLEMI